MSGEVVAFKITDGTWGEIQAGDHVCLQVDEGAPTDWLGSVFCRVSTVNRAPNNTGEIIITGHPKTPLPGGFGEIEATYHPYKSRGIGRAFKNS